MEIGIGLIERGGSYLVRQRPPLPGSPMPGVWEFPGGKCDPGETSEAATVRECYEETGLRVRVQRFRRRIEHCYPHGYVALNFYDVTLEDEETAAGSGFRWVAAADLIHLEFPGANEPILREIAEGA